MSFHRFGAALLLVGAATLSGCGWVGGVFGGREPEKLVCPGSFIAPDADKLAMFKPGTAPALENVLYGVRVSSINSRCERVEKGVVVNSRVEFQLVANDPEMRAGSFAYFVSVVDAQQNILTKQIYAMPFEFDRRERDLAKHEDLVEKLPLLKISTGGNYAIVVGLQLTPEQLEFNRAASRAPAMPVPPKSPLPPSTSATAPTPSAPRP